MSKTEKQIIAAQVAINEKQIEQLNATVEKYAQGHKDTPAVKLAQKIYDQLKLTPSFNIKDHKGLLPKELQLDYEGIQEAAKLVRDASSIAAAKMANTQVADYTECERGYYRGNEPYAASIVIPSVMFFDVKAKASKTVTRLDNEGGVIGLDANDIGRLAHHSRRNIKTAMNRGAGATALPDGSIELVNTEIHICTANSSSRSFEDGVWSNEGKIVALISVLSD